MEYYEVKDNLEMENRWYLNRLHDSRGVRLDDRDFTYGHSIKLDPPMRLSVWNEDATVNVGLPLKLSIYREKTAGPLDFTFTNSDMPVVTSRVAEILAAIAATDIQRIPVQVEGREEPYEIINVVSCIACVDRDRSDADWWTEADGRPEKIGRAKLVERLAVDPTKTGGAHLLRPKEWDLTIVASEPVKQALEKAKVSGIRFTKVTLNG